MHKFCNLFYCTLGVACLVLSGWAMSLYFPNLYFNCESLSNCHYVKIPDTNNCYVEVVLPETGYNYTCTKTPCPYTFKVNQTSLTEICYLGPDTETCPYETCFNKDLVTAVLVAGALTLGAMFIMAFTVYNCIVFLSKCKRGLRGGYDIV